MSVHKFCSSAYRVRKLCLNKDKVYTLISGCFLLYFSFLLLTSFIFWVVLYSCKYVSSVNLLLVLFGDIQQSDHLADSRMNPSALHRCWLFLQLVVFPPQELHNVCISNISVLCK